MKHYDFDRPSDLRDLVFQYEVVSQKGTVLSLEETAFLQLVIFFEKEHSVAKAMSVINQAIAQHKFSGILHKKKAELLLTEQNSELALESLDRAEVFGQPIKDVDMLRARAFVHLGKFNEALELLGNLRFYEYLGRQERSELLFTESCIHEKLQQFEQMYESLRDALLENPDNEKALERFWVAVELCKKHQDSIDLHHYILDINPYNYRAWYNIGHAYYSTNQYVEAIEAFEYAFLINEEFEHAYRDYAEICFEMKYYDKALRCYLEFVEHFEADADILAKIGQCLQYTDKIGKAKIYFFRALGLDQRNDEVYFHIGECYAQENLWPSAIHFYRQAIRLDNEREDYLFSLAKAYMALGRNKKAAPLFLKAVEAAPEQTTYWITYALFYLKQGQMYKALEIIEDAELNSCGADIYFCKAAFLFMLEKDKDAMEAMREGLSIDYSQHELLFELLPDRKEDKKIKDILNYFKYE
ncbi:MAG: tetratricopeptide repeat protein [Bacteroidota bacterium]